jgi:WD40 repeat protein
MNHLFPLPFIKILIMALILLQPTLSNHSYQDNNQEIYNISLSPDGNKILAYMDSTINIISSHTLQTITSIPIDTQKKVNAIWKPDSNYIAVAIEGGVIEIWDSNIGLLVATLSGHPQGSEISDIEWIDNTLYSMNLFGVLIIWDMVNYQSVQVLSIDGNDLALSPDGKTLAIATFLDISLVNLNTMTITVFIEQSAQITSVIWSSNGQKIASSSMDGTIRIWGLDNSDNPESIWDVNTPNDTPWIADLYWNDGYLAVRQLYNDSVVILDDQTGEKLDTILVENGRFIWSGNTGYYATFRNDSITLYKYCDEITQPEAISNISQGIMIGNSNIFGNTICLSPNATYTLTTTLPTITGDITLIGNGARLITLDNQPVFDVAEGGNLTLKDVVISGGQGD